MRPKRRWYIILRYRVRSLYKFFRGWKRNDWMFWATLTLRNHKREQYLYKYLYSSHCAFNCHSRSDPSHQAWDTMQAKVIDNFRNKTRALLGSIYRSQQTIDSWPKGATVALVGFATRSVLNALNNSDMLDRVTRNVSMPQLIEGMIWAWKRSPSQGTGAPVFDGPMSRNEVYKYQEGCLAGGSTGQSWRSVHTVRVRVVR